MEDNIKLYSQMEPYEVININDGTKYRCLGDNDVAFDDDGNLKMLILNDVKTRISLFGKSDFIEVPWDYVKKIGPKTIIIDAEEKNLRRSR